MTQRSADSTVEWLIGEIITTHRAKILSCYDELLARAHSPLVTGTLARDLHQQAAAVLAEVCARLTGTDPPPPRYPQSGAKRGGPELLWAAGALCEAVLTTVAEQLPDRPGLTGGVVRLALLLHQTTAERFAAGALDYLGYLVAALHRSHADERRRVARELHDLVAHSVAVALQNLELYSLSHDTDPDRAGQKLAAAVTALRDSVDLVRALAQDLRRSGAEDGLEAALRAYAATMVPDGTTCQIRVRGEEDRVPPPIRGELFLILREALHNSIRHAAAGRIEVDVAIGPRAVRARVVDDGRGFDVYAAPAGAGLASMRERAALLPGGVEVSSTPGHGAAVHVEVPLRPGDEPD
jgi:signal transduction histidine kinase